MRHALLLKKHGDAEQADVIFREVLKRVDLAPKYYGREQREWVDIAKRELG